MFASRDFRLLLAAVTLEATPFEVGMLGAASTIAFAVLGLPAGAWVDRMRRRPVLIASDVVRALLLATIPLAALFGLVNATMQVVVMGLFPVGALIGGLLGDAIGARWTLIVAGLLLLACTLVLWGSLRGVREVSDLPQPAPSAAALPAPPAPPAPRCE